MLCPFCRLTWCFLKKKMSGLLSSFGSSHIWMSSNLPCFAPRAKCQIMNEWGCEVLGEVYTVGYTAHSYITSLYSHVRKYFTRTLHPNSVSSRPQRNLEKKLLLTADSRYILIWNFETLWLLNSLVTVDLNIRNWTWYFNCARTGEHKAWWETNNS